MCMCVCVCVSYDLSYVTKTYIYTNEYTNQWQLLGKDSGITGLFASLSL